MNNQEKDRYRLEGALAYLKKINDSNLKDPEALVKQLTEDHLKITSALADLYLEDLKEATSAYQLPAAAAT